MLPEKNKEQDMAQRPERGGGRNNRRDEEEQSEFVDKLVHINRVAKVVKGGRRFGFAALVVVETKKAASALVTARPVRFPKQFVRLLNPQSAT